MIAFAAVVAVAAVTFVCGSFPLLLRNAAAAAGLIGWISC